MAKRVEETYWVQWVENIYETREVPYVSGGGTYREKVKVGEKTWTAEVCVIVDVDAIARVNGPAAGRNKSGKSSAMNGKVVVKRIGTAREVKP